jgi:hypothetical protein
MHHVPRSRLLLSATVLTLVVAFAGIAAASTSPYTVAVTVTPRTVPLHHLFKVTLKGESSNTSTLWLFIDVSRTCSATRKENASHSSNQLAEKWRVTGAYTRIYKHAALNEGNHFACAYLTSLTPPTPRAHAGAAYSVG